MTQGSGCQVQSYQVNRSSAVKLKLPGQGKTTIRPSADRLPFLSGLLGQRQKHLDLQVVIDY